MAVNFPDKIHPKNKLRLRFEYKMGAFQYLDYFNITISYPIYKFIPLNLDFESEEELQQFLYRKGIVFDEINVSSSYSQLSNEFTIVDTSKIYDVEESVSKYLLNFKYYSINEVAEILSFSRPTIYKIIKDGNLKTYRINGQLRIKHSDLNDYINKENSI